MSHIATDLDPPHPRLHRFDVLAGAWLIIGSSLVALIPYLRELPWIGNGWLILVAMPIISLLTAPRLPSAAAWRDTLVRAPRRRRQHLR